MVIHKVLKHCHMPLFKRLDERSTVGGKANKRHQSGSKKLGISDTANQTECFFSQKSNIHRSG